MNVLDQLIDFFQFVSCPHNELYIPFFHCKLFMFTVFCTSSVVRSVVQVIQYSHLMEGEYLRVLIVRFPPSECCNKVYKINFWKINFLILSCSIFTSSLKACSICPCEFHQVILVLGLQGEMIRPCVQREPSSTWLHGCGSRMCRHTAFCFHIRIVSF